MAADLTADQQRLLEVLLRRRGLDRSRLPIPPRTDNARAPLSFTQQRLWTSGQSAIGTSYGNVPIAFRVRGSLDFDCLGRALSLVTARHEILRTTYDIEDGTPLQRIHPPTTVGVPVEDLRTMAPPERAEGFRARVAEEARRPFDLTSPPLLRAHGFRADDAEFGLVMVSHHLATDGWGARLLLDELSAAYGAFADGREPDLPHLAVQYGDYASWEAERLDDGEWESQRRYWVERLAGAPRQLRLPFDFPPSNDVATESVQVSLSEDLSRGLRQLARTRGVTPYVTLLAAFKALLHQYTGQDDLVVGTILSRRTRSETEPLIGNFGNNLLLRTSLSGDPSLTEVIDRTGATMRDALANSDVPLEWVAQTAPIPAFHVMFILRDGNYEERFSLPGASVDAVRAESGAATLDLSLDITDGSRRIEGHFEYRTARFARETMERFAHAFEDVVARLVSEPHARLSVFARPQDERVSDSPKEMRAAGEEPATPTERVLAELWREWLELGVVYRDDNFFRLGGDSLRAVYVLQQAERKLGYRFQPEDLSKATLRELAAARDSHRAVHVATSRERESALDVQPVNPLEFADQIKRLFEREGFPQYCSFFDRAYPGAVGEGARSWIARNERGELVGHIAMFTHRFTHDGATYTGALGANLVVDRQHRNLANALALVGRVVTDLESQGDVDFLFGDPNDDARAVMSTIGGFREIGVLRRHVLPIGDAGVRDLVARGYLAATLRRRRKEPIDMTVVSAKNFDATEVEVPPDRADTLCPHHPLELYRRRLAGYPADGDQWCLFTRDGTRTAAVLVRTFRGAGRAQACCVWRQPGAPVSSMLRPIVAALRASGVTRLQAVTLEASSLGRELRAAGFRRRDAGIPFIVRPSSARGRLLIEDGVDWEITDLDCDRGFSE